MAKTKNDIILLHGRELKLTDQIISYLSSLGLSSGKIETLSTGGANQKTKVESYIKNCRLPIVIATFDGNSSSVRSNVVNELTICEHLRKGNYLVLREIKKGKKVELGSNIENTFAEVCFEIDDTFTLITMLNKELLSRGLLSKGVTKKSKEKFDKKRGDAEGLNDFLDKMDRVWEDEFDVAADNIEKNDAKTENEFQYKLDAFFLKYWAVFDAMIRGKKEGNVLKKICEVKLAEAYGLAFDVWHIIIESRIEYLKEKIEKKKSAKTITLDVNEVEKLLDDISEMFRKTKKPNFKNAKSDTSEKSKIEKLKEINIKIDDLLKRI